MRIILWITLSEGGKPVHQKYLLFFFILLKLYRNILPLLHNFCLHPAKTLRIGSNISLNHSNIDLEKLSNLSLSISTLQRRNIKFFHTYEGYRGNFNYLEVWAQPVQINRVWWRKFHPKSTSKLPKDTNKRRKNYLLSLGSSYMK